MAAEAENGRSTPSFESPEAAAQYHVLAGEVAAGRRQPRVAAEEFLKALEIIPDATLANRATTLAIAANDEGLALKAAQRWLAIERNSLEAREVILRLAVRANETEAAFEQCQAIVRDHPGGKSDGFRHVSLLLSQEGGKGPQALALMERLVARSPKLAGAWQAQGLLALRFNDIDRAEKSAREALRLEPGSKEAPLLLTGALVRKGEVAAAEEILEAQANASPNGAELRLGFARLLIEANQRPLAVAQLKKVLKAEPANSDALYMTGLLALDEGRVEEAEAQFRTLLDDKDRGGDAHYYLGRIAEQRGNTAAALAEYEQVSSGTQALDAAVRRANMLAKSGRLADARVTLEQLRSQFPPLAVRFYLAEGQLLMDAGDYEALFALYARGISESGTEPDLLYARSLAYERTNQIALAEADLRLVLDANPSDARALNALGFMLTVHTERYADAEKLIAKALVLTPDEPAVIDSLGWLRFRQGRKDEAVKLLARAYEVFPDPEVAAHFGEALWTSGERDQAKLIFDQAIKAAPDHPVLRETVNRLSR